MSYLEEANTTTAATHSAATRAILTFCVSKIHQLPASLVTAQDQEEVLETLAHMISVQTSLSMLTIALVIEDANVINSAKILLRSVP
jgi:hypothetical protein